MSASLLRTAPRVVAPLRATPYFVRKPLGSYPVPTETRIWWKNRYQVCFPIFTLFAFFVVPWWPDSELGQSIPAEGHVAVFLGISITVAAPVPDRVGKCRNPVRVGLHIIFAE